MLQTLLIKMPRATSRSPSKRRSPNERYIRRHSRRDRSRSPYRYSHIRRKSLSPSERRHRSRSTSPRRRVHKKHRSRSVSRSPIRKSRSPSLGLAERKRVLEKAQQEEERKRRQKEAELKLLEEETARRIEEAIKKRVEEALNSAEVKLEIQICLEDGRKKMLQDVAVQLKWEKQDNVSQAKLKEEEARKQKEELDRMVEEKKSKIEQEQLRAILEQQQKEEERYRELEALQQQKEEAIRRQKLEEEQQRAEQMKLLGKNKARPKLSFALGFK